MVIIIGGGISGLAAAYFLKKQGIESLVLESEARIGGCLYSVETEQEVLEKGANSLLCDSKMRALLKQLNLEGEIIETNAVSKNRFIYKNGKYRVLPSSPPALLKSNFFSLHTKLKILRELFAKKRQVGVQETLSEFFIRHFGKEIHDYALAPFVAGIYAGDPSKLLVSKTFPQLAAYQENYGSILRGFIKNGSAERRNSISFKKGMQALPQAMAAEVAVRYEAKVANLERVDKQWIVVLSNGEKLKADKIVLAIPAKAAARLLRPHAKRIADVLERIHYPPMAVCHLVYPQGAVSHGMEGFGALHPRREGLFSAGMIWTSSLFEGKCSPSDTLFTCFVGGSQFEQAARLAPNEILKRLQNELAELYGIKGEASAQYFYLWEQAIPQYDENVLPLPELLEALEQQQLFVSANWHGGVSVPDCIWKSERLATQIAMQA